MQVIRRHSLSEAHLILTPPREWTSVFLESASSSPECLPNSGRRKGFNNSMADRYHQRQGWDNEWSGWFPKDLWLKISVDRIPKGKVFLAPSPKLQRRVFCFLLLKKKFGSPHILPPSKSPFHTAPNEDEFPSSFSCCSLKKEIQNICPWYFSNSVVA